MCFFFQLREVGIEKWKLWMAEFKLRQAGRSSVSGSHLQPWPRGTCFPGSSVKTRYLSLCTEAYFVARNTGNELEVALSVL